jgi:uncharacterized repeat protein (TIGR03803 family)
LAFKLDAAGQETILHTFAGGTDGSYPFAGVIRDASGNLYGTTTFGGVSCSYPYSGPCGVVFKVDAAGNETVLYAFGGFVAGVSASLVPQFQDTSCTSPESRVD